MHRSFAKKNVRLKLNKGKKLQDSKDFDSWSSYNNNSTERDE